MNTGFTGTRRGMTLPQVDRAEEFLRARSEGKFHHGDCVGSDQQACLLARLAGLWTISHPPIQSEMRAYAYSDEVRQERDNLARDRDIVAESDELLATPAGPERRRGSGTWATIRYARKKGIPIHIIWPDGSVTTENL